MGVDTAEIEAKWLAKCEESYAERYLHSEPPDVITAYKFYLFHIALSRGYGPEWLTFCLNEFDQPAIDPLGADASLSKKIYVEAMCRASELMQVDSLQQLLDQPFNAFKQQQSLVTELLIYNILADRPEVLKMLLTWVEGSELVVGDLTSCMTIGPFFSVLSWAVLFDRTKCLEVLFAHQSAEQWLQSGVLQKISQLADDATYSNEGKFCEYLPHVFGFIACVDRLQDKNERDELIDIMLTDGESFLKQLIDKYQQEIVNRMRCHDQGGSGLRVDINLPDLRSVSTRYECYQSRLSSPINMLWTARKGLSQDSSVRAFQLDEKIKSTKIMFLQLINAVDPFSEFFISIFKKEAFIDFLETLPNKVILDVAGRALNQSDSWAYKVFHAQRGIRAVSTERGQLGRLNQILKNKAVLMSSEPVIGSHSTMYAKRDLTQAFSRPEEGNRFIKDCDL